jgi:lipopolysaccharide transport system ATP-binding protein
MSDPIITVEGLGKKYQIDHQAERGRYKTLREAITERARRVFGAGRSSRPGTLPFHGSNRPTSEEFWALRDVSFQVNRGEVVGIIGRNGAGKSTLLKILSRIIEPSTGRVHIRGRVASLLEVGTGFHPELTGRENIFLNGAILGMSKAEIRRKFDEIVAFSEVEKFLDTPVKRYSSGMYVRLAFAVAAHLEPEILIVDEVLAVGDAEFQKKCLGKMQDVAGHGRTVLFVSHNLDAIAAMCQNAIYLEKGRIVDSGEVKHTLRRYMNNTDSDIAQHGAIWRRPSAGAGIGMVHAEQHGVITDTIVCGEEFAISIEINLSPDCVNHEIGFGFIDEDGRDILHANNKHLHQELQWPRQGKKIVKITLPFLNWIANDYVYLVVYFGWVGDQYEILERILKLRLIKQFPHGLCDRLVEQKNKIYIDGVEFIEWNAYCTSQSDHIQLTDNQKS